MKKKLLCLLSSVLLVLSIAGSASAFALNNWFFDVDGAGVTSAVQIAELFDITSPNFVDTTFSDANNYTFTNTGVVYAGTYDGSSTFAALGVEITGVYSFTGNATLSGGINFTGGSLALYVDTSFNYGTALGAAGADGGTQIATFDLISGGGFVGATGLPNGLFSLTYETTSLTPGYFFMPNGVTDMSTMSPISLVLGYTTTNASATAVVPALMQAELIALAGYIGTPGTPPNDFFLSSNGQFRIDIVPEPATMLLFGVGLLSLAGVSRKRLIK